MDPSDCQRTSFWASSSFWVSGLVHPPSLQTVIIHNTSSNNDIIGSFNFQIVKSGGRWETDPVKHISKGGTNKGKEFCQNRKHRLLNNFTLCSVWYVHACVCLCVCKCCFKALWYSYTVTSTILSPGGYGTTQHLVNFSWNISLAK